MLILWFVTLVVFVDVAAETESEVPDPPVITVTMDDTTYALGDTAEVTFGNHAERAALFALFCDAVVEGWGGAEWRTVFKPDCSRVRVRPTRLEPGTSVTLPLVIEPCDADELSRYEWFRLKVRFQFANGGGYQTEHSPRFAITALERD